MELLKLPRPHSSSTKLFLLGQASSASTRSMLREREYRQNEMFRGVLLHARVPGISVLVCVAFVPDAGHICCSQASEKKHLPLHQKKIKK